MTNRSGYRTLMWFEAQLEILRRGAADGFSSAAIARMIGCGCTRSAVLGKASRLGLKLSGGLGGGGRRGPRKPKAGPTLSTPETPPTLEATGTSLVPVLAPPPPAVPLSSRPCQWPVGDPQDKDFHFCGEMSQDGRPYCPGHCKVAYVAARPYDPDATRENKRRGHFRSFQVGSWT